MRLFTGGPLTFPCRLVIAATQLSVFELLLDLLAPLLRDDLRLRLLGLSSASAFFLASRYDIDVILLWSG